MKRPTVTSLRHWRVSNKHRLFQTDLHFCPLLETCYWLFSEPLCYFCFVNSIRGLMSVFHIVWCASWLLLLVFCFFFFPSVCSVKWHCLLQSCHNTVFRWRENVLPTLYLDRMIQRNVGVVCQARLWVTAFCGAMTAAAHSRSNHVQKPGLMPLSLMLPDVA